MSTVEESTEVATVDQKAASTKLMTIEPKVYVAQVFEPFAKRYADGVDAVRNVAYDIKTTAGMATAVKFRALFRDIRTESEKMRKLRKAPILEIGKLLDARQGDIEATSLPLEFLFDEEIDAEISRKEAIKVEQRRVEEERQKAIQAGIDSVKAYVVTVAGKSSADIDKASLELDFREITLEEFGDRTGEATQAKILTLEKLSEMFDEALAREQEAIRVAAQLEADRVERERVAEANRLESERLAKLAREIEERDAAARAEEEQRNRAAVAARAAADKEADDRRAEADRVAEANRAAAQKILDDQAALLRAQQEAADKAAREAREAEEARAAAERAEVERVEREAREAEQARLDAEAEERRRAEQAEAETRRAAEEAAHAAEQKLRNAAPVLMHALQVLVGDIKQSPVDFTRAEKLAIARAAIAEATA